MSSTNSRSRATIAYTTIEMQPDPEAGSDEQITETSEEPQEQITQPTSFMDVCFPQFTVKSFVFAITLIQIIMIIVAVYEGIPINVPAGIHCSLYKLGGKHTPSIITYFQFERLILPTVLHGSLGPLLMNLMALSYFGYRLEKAYGTLKFVFVYLISGIGGNLLSAIAMPDNLSVGASSSIFGLIGLELVYIIKSDLLQGPVRQTRLISMVVVILTNLGIGNLAENNADLATHIGGFIAGVLASIVVLDAPSDPEFYIKRRLAIGVLFTFFLTLGAMLMVMAQDPQWVIAADQFSTMCRKVRG